MAKILEDVIVIKLSKMVKNHDSDGEVIDDDTRKLIEETIPKVIEEVLSDTSVVVEIAELE